MDISTLLILADESANWKIAGLRQLDRLVLEISEFAAKQRIDKVDIFIFWKQILRSEQSWSLEDPRLTRCRVHIARTIDRSMPLLSTCLLLKRRALEDFISSAALARAGDTWEELARAFTLACSGAKQTAMDGWRCVAAREEIPTAERWFLAGSGKPQDGFVSKYLNRPISRAISRMLLKTDVTPGAWTLAIFTLAIAGCVLLLRGDYFGFVTGAALFQIFSILDGCDGEMARAKYLESERGRCLDMLGDILGNILFALGLGFGLHQSGDWCYAAEGIVCAALIAATESLLARGYRGVEGGAASRPDLAIAPRPSLHGETPRGAVVGDRFYARHRALLDHLGLSSRGEKRLAWLFQLTKRDTAILSFLLLAIFGWPQWILHIWIMVSAAMLALTLTARSHPRV